MFTIIGDVQHTAVSQNCLHASYGRGLNIAAFNVGIALGSVIGGQTVEHYGLAQTPWIGALIVVGALLLTGLSGRLDKTARVALS